MSTESSVPGISVIGYDIHIKDMTTSGGRFLKENRAVTQGLPVHMAVCPYPDSRIGMKMNAEAKASMLAGWRELLDGLGWVSVNYFGGNPPVQVTLDQLDELSSISAFLPVYLVNRSQDRFGRTGELPDVVGNMYKASAGIAKTVNGLRSREAGEIVVSPESIYQTAEQYGDLVFKGGDASEVCAAERKMITNALDALLYAKNSHPEKSILSTLGIDFPSLKSFAGYSATFLHFQGMYLDVYALTFKEMQYILRENNMELPDDRTEFDELADIYSSAEDQLVAVAGPLQDGINVALGRDPKSLEHPTRADITRVYGFEGLTPRTIRDAFPKLS